MCEYHFKFICGSVSKIPFLFYFPQLDLWQQCAGLFTPAATFLQCRKYFEQKRTAFGKIEAFEMKSGSEARDRTAREEDILETWSFLKGHISHSTTTTSQRFSSDRDSSSSDMSGLSAHSIQRRKAVKKKRTGEPTPSTPPLTQLEVEAQRNRVLSSLLEQASQLTGPKQPQPQGMSTAEMYGKMIGEQLARVKKEDLLTVVIPILNILSNYFNKPQQPQPTPMHPPPAPAQTPVPRNPLPRAGPQHPMHPGPAFPPHYGQEQSPVYPVASTSGLQQQQPPHMPATSYQPTTPVISGYPPYPVPMPSTSGYQPPAMPSTSGYQPPAMPSTSGPIQQKPQPSTYPATYGPGRFTHDTPPVYTPLSGVSSNKPATTHTSPSKRPFLDSLDNLDSLSPLYPPTPSPLQSALRALSTNSDTLNTPVTKPSEEEENDDE